MIEIRDLSFSRGNKTLFQNSNVTIFPGNKLGLIGENGSGKSSLFSLMLKNAVADAGDVLIPEKIVIAHMEQEISNLQENILAYVMQGDIRLYNVQQKIQRAEKNHDSDQLINLYAQLENLDGYNAKHKAETLLSGLGFHVAQFDQPIASLSGGWQMRLSLAKALMCPSDLLLLDEPTNHLDIDTIIWLEEFLSNYKGTLIVISHDREFLDAITNYTLSIAQQQLTLYKGNYTSYEQQFAATLELQQAQAKKTEQRIQHLNKFITRFKAKASKAKQAQSRIKALNKLESIAPFQVRQAVQFEFKSPDKTPHSLLQLNNIEFAYSDHTILKNVSFKIFAENRIGILGINGAGKSTLIKIIAGHLTPKNGDLNQHKDINIGYFAQDFVQQLELSYTPIMQYKNNFPELSDQEIRNHLGSFGFGNDMALQEIENFSGGEKARLALSILVWQRPNLLILDEPTNHLDLGVRESLTFALQSYEGALLLVSHDRHLLENTCDEFYLMDDGKLSQFSGDLEDYRAFTLAKRKQNIVRETETEIKITKKTARQEAARNRQKLQPLTSEIKSLETKLEKLHQRNEELESLLVQSHIYDEQNKDQLKKLLAEKAELDATLEETEHRWLETSEKLEVLKKENNL